MTNQNFKLLSNSEIKIKLVELENEYESCKNKIRDLFITMNQIDKEYTEGKMVLDKRTGGINL